MAFGSMASPPCCALWGSVVDWIAPSPSFDMSRSTRYQSHGIGKGYTGGFHEYFGPDADIDSQILRRKNRDLKGSTVQH